METSRESGVSALLGPEAIPYVRTTTVQNWRTLTSYFRSSWGPAAFLAAMVLGLGGRRRWLEPESRMPLVLTAMAACYLGWWLFVSTGGRIRYLLIGLGLWCCAVVADLFGGPWSLRKLALAFGFAAAVLPRAEVLRWIAPARPLFEPSPRTAAMLEGARFLEEHRGGRLIAADWWATGCDMEYLLSGSGSLVHFKSLEGLASPRVLFLENAKWLDLPRVDRRPWDEAVRRYGATLAFEKETYRIYAVPPIEAYQQEEDSHDAAGIPRRPE